MPARSKAQQHLFLAALYAKKPFPMAAKVRQSMTPEQMKDFTHLAPKAPAKKGKRRG